MTIKEAIERSISHNESVHVEVDDLQAGIDQVTAEWDGETDHHEDSRGVGDGIDIFGWTDETAREEMEFRLFLYAAEK